ncbi:MAG: GlmU family protein [Bacteroidales bacterium]|nr:GlmU family protein [Bacteroidales bacterium]
MKNSEGISYILFDGPTRDHLLPLTYTRPVAELRIGILTVREKWEKILQSNCSFLTQDYLQEKYPCRNGKENILINGSVIPSAQLTDEIHRLKQESRLMKNGLLIACNIADREAETISFEEIEKYPLVESDARVTQLEHVWDIFSKNGEEIKKDFDILTAGRESLPLSNTNKVLHPENVFLEEGAVAECAVINATDGPVYLGKDAEIMEGSLVRGALALCEHAALKMGAKVYGPTTIGPHTKVGGEINNSVILGYSNKAHDGFLGNSVIGEWCNLGADTNTSNLKNNYAEVKLWDYQKEGFANTGLQFCGLIMGDHSKCGINTMFNTGTVVGVSANIFGDGFSRNFIPSFSWGGAAGFIVYNFSKAMEVAEIVMKRRNITLTATDKKILENVFRQTARYRTRNK